MIRHVYRTGSAVYLVYATRPHCLNASKISSKVFFCVIVYLLHTFVMCFVYILLQKTKMSWRLVCSEKRDTKIHTVHFFFEIFTLI